jgi:hypothetical protein
LELTFGVPFSDSLIRTISTFGIDRLGTFSDASISTFGIDLLGPFSDALIRTISTFGIDLLGPFSYALIRTISTFGIDLWVPFSDALIRTISTFGVDLLGPLFRCFNKQLERSWLWGAFVFFTAMSRKAAHAFSQFYTGPRGFGAAHLMGSTQWGQQAREVRSAQVRCACSAALRSTEKKKGQAGKAALYN